MLRINAFRAGLTWPNLLAGLLLVWSLIFIPLRDTDTPYSQISISAVGFFWLYTLVAICLPGHIFLRLAGVGRLCLFGEFGFAWVTGVASQSVVWYLLAHVGLGMYAAPVTLLIALMLVPFFRKPLMGERTQVGEGSPRPWENIALAIMVLMALLAVGQAERSMGLPPP